MTKNTGTGGDAGNDPRVEAALDVRWPNKEWRNFLPQDKLRERREMAAILSAADAARAVGDEEVLNILENSRTYTDALTALHAAGMKVLRA